MKIENALSDDAVLAEIGRRAQRRRLENDLTQAQLAEESGVSKRTVERLEGGASVQLTSLVRVLRTLRLLDHLDVLLPPAEPGPIDLLKRGKSRRRAKQGVRESRDPWKWGDES